MHKVIIDTNILVSSLFGGKPREIIELWADGYFTLCLSNQILAEYLEVIARFRDVKGGVRELANLLITSKAVLSVQPSAPIFEVETDPSDNMFLECALAAKADAIVSGDRHLLALRAFRGIPVLEPAEFLRRFPTARR